MADIRRTVYDKLRAGGLTHNAALGVIANFSYESDGFKAMEEYAPNRHGTKGAGIAMWTDAPKGAKRRTMYESWMKENDKDLNSIEDQLDYFFYEMENHPENMPGGRNMTIDKLNEAATTVEAGADFFMKKFEAPKNQSKKHLKKRLEHIRDFDIKPDEEPVIKGKGIEKAIEKQKDVIPSKLGTDNNVQSIMNRINFSKSTVEGRQYDRIERFIKSHLDKDEEPLTNTPEERIAKVAIDTIGKDELVPEEVVVPEAAVPPVEPVLDLGIKPEQVQQAEGGIQPNGRKSTFTREEDLQAQENTYNPLNIF